MPTPASMISITRARPYTAAFVYAIDETPILIENPNNSSFDQFGEAVYATNTHIAVGAPRTEDSDNNPTEFFGAAYLFETDGTLVYSWTNEDADAGGNSTPAADQFGESVGITADHILIGAPVEDVDGSQRGTIYVYNLDDGLYNNRFQLNMVGVTHSTPEGYFGSHTAIGIGEGNFFIGGAPSLSVATGRNGEGRAQAMDAPSSTGTILPNPGYPVGGTGSTVNSNFGCACYGGGGYYVIGCSGLDDSSDNSIGAAFIYDQTDDHTSVTLLWEIVSPSPINNGFFGHAVAINSTYCAVTELTGDSVHIYESATGNFVRTLTTPGLGNQFGNGLAMSEQFLVVGDSSSSGGVYVYDPSGENLLYTLDPPAAAQDFGSAVSISETVLVVGASDYSSEKGRVYVYPITAS